MFDARYAAVSWPIEYGGREASRWEWLIFEEEYYRAGGPQRVTQNGIFLLAPTIFELGTIEQRDHVLPRMAAAENLWCQGWSEPSAGSDLAALTCRATRDGGRGGWVLDGQKTWTTRGAFCTHLFGLFRTDPGSDRHRGLTYLLVPLDLQGVTVRGFARLDGDEGFAEVFFDDAFLPDDALPGGVVLGVVGEGWSVAMATTSSERGLTLRAPGRFTATAARLVELYRERATVDDDLDPGLRDRVVQGWMEAEAYRWQTLQTVTDEAEGRPAGAASSFVKLWWSELDVSLHETALDLLGPDAELEAPWTKQVAKVWADLAEMACSASPSTAATAASARRTGSCWLRRPATQPCPTRSWRRPAWSPRCWPRPPIPTTWWRTWSPAASRPVSSSSMPPR